MKNKKKETKTQKTFIYEVKRRVSISPDPHSLFLLFLWMNNSVSHNENLLWIIYFKHVLKII